MIMTKKELIKDASLFLFYGVFSAITFVVVGDSLHLMLAWNLFLAAVPLVFVTLYEWKVIDHKVVTALWVVLWLLFYPNAIYMVTDLIYINRADFIDLFGLQPSNYYVFVDYFKNTSAYLAFFHILFGALIGLYFGITSLAVVYKGFSLGRWRKWRHVIVVAVALLAGIAVYIGRFLRYNSWDLTAVFKILRDLFAEASGFMLFFIFMIALVQLVPFYLFRKEKSSS